MRLSRLILKRFVKMALALVEAEVATLAPVEATMI
jgi:hypothetical protein